MDQSRLEQAFQHACRLQESGHYRQAEQAYRRFLGEYPDHAGGHNNLGLVLMALGELDEAVTRFRQVVALQPDHAQAHNNMGVAYKRMARPQQALDCYAAALRCRPAYAQALLNVGTIYYELKDYDEALIWYQAALEVDPDQIEVHMNLAAIFESRGELEEAKKHRDAVYSRKAVYVDHACDPRMTVLVLWGAGLGNIPTEYLLPRKSVTRIVCVIEYARPDELARLPDYDLVLNAIGDPDVMDPALEPMARLLHTCGKPVINPAQAVARTARHLIPDLLGGIENVVVPCTLRVESAALRDALHALPGNRFPILLRPVGSHGGDHLDKLESKADVAAFKPWPAPYYYLTDYVDYASADAGFRKYRVIFVDRQPYAYHLAIGSHWIVHHDTAGMQHDARKRREEEAFLADPRQALGDKAMAAIEALGHVLDLDYGGVDFSVLPDGRVLVFEANATMLAHPEKTQDIYDYKNPYVQKIYDAFDAMLARRMAAARGHV
ncbi:tetratricopeptide repeat protein [Bordetella sp. FB-8]|uniref:tetratricopeptide repeat protein n=1 Tax=Bordetella sp. FB-8 TaxID=1159870 RepID=UPI0003687E6E|nr:tetratricopeptide repeat protein [Bordetella sp. FB-8]